MHRIDCRNWLVQVTAVLLLIFNVHVHANDCAGGTDATGKNHCSGNQAEQEASATDSHLLFLKGAASLASLRLERAQQRQSEASTSVKEREAELKAARQA